MRSSRALALLCGLAVGGASLAASTAVAFDHTFHIKKGKHRANGFPLFNVQHPKMGKHQDRTLRFRARFAPNALYRSKNPSNQFDFCKLLGISTGKIHGTSLRLGWRAVPSENVMEVGVYAYLNGARVMEPLAKVRPGEWIDVELRLHNGGISVKAGARTYQKAQAMKFKALTTTWLLRTAYFGGDETAPQDITIDVAGVSIN